MNLKLPKGNQFWIFIGRTDAEAETPILWPPAVKNWLIEKDPGAGKDWRQEEKGTTEDEMVGCHPWLNGHEFEEAPGVGDGQGSLTCCSPWGRKELDTTEWLKWLTDCSIYKVKTNKRWRIRNLRVSDLNKSHSCFKEIVLEQLNSHMGKKNETRPLSHAIYKINLKCIIDLNIKAKTVKFLD